MKIIIAGAGEVGTHLAKMLSNEDQDIIILDTDERRLTSLENYNLMTCVGSAISFEDLKNVNVDKCDLFIAVTPYETRNMLACSMAKHMGAKKTVGRIDNYEFLLKAHSSYFKQLGVDDLIYPEYLAAKEIRTALKHTWVRNWFELFDGELIVAAVKLRSNSKLRNKPLRDMGNIADFMHVSAIKRNRETIIPRGDDVIRANDIVYIATTHDHLDKVIDVCGKSQIDVKKLMMMGGSPIAVQIAKTLQDQVKIKIIDPDEQRCQYLSDILPNCSIVHGDATDADILEEEGVSDTDVFAALSDRSETNILSCMMAKEHGVRKTIAEVESMQFIAEAESLNIGTIINKKLLASSRIFQILLDSDVNNARCLALADAEVAELILKPDSKVCKKDVRDLSLPDGMTIAGVVRDGEGMLVKGDTRLQPGDHVCVFCLSGVFHTVEKYFSK